MDGTLSALMPIIYQQDVLNDAPVLPGARTLKNVAKNIFKLKV
jgi:hypothetical protein